MASRKCILDLLVPGYGGCLFCAEQEEPWFMYYVKRGTEKPTRTYPKSICARLETESIGLMARMKLNIYMIKPDAPMNWCTRLRPTRFIRKGHASAGDVIRR